MTNIADYFYHPVDLDDELFLSDIPLDVLQGLIKTQFECPLEYRKKDYLQTFITKYEFSVENMAEDDLFNLDTYHDRFISFMLQIFEENLNVGFVDIDQKSEEDQHEILHLTYRFFIKNIKKNFVNCILSFINDRKDEMMNIIEKKKDVTTISFKSEIDDEYDILVLSSLNDIIRYSFDKIRRAFDVDEFFTLCESDEYSLELEYVRNCYEKMLITGNFLESYVDMVDDSDFIMEIQSKVRNKILKKYPKRKAMKKEEIEELKNEVNDDETESEINNNEEE